MIDKRRDQFGPKALAGASIMSRHQFCLKTVFLWMTYCAFLGGSWGWVGGLDRFGLALVPTYFIIPILILTRGAALIGVLIGTAFGCLVAGRVVYAFYGSDAEVFALTYAIASVGGWLGGGIHALAIRRFGVGTLAFSPLLVPLVVPVWPAVVLALSLLVPAILGVAFIRWWNQAREHPGEML